MRVASKVGNLPSKFGYAWPLGSRIMCCVRDRRADRLADRQTDEQKQCLLPPCLWSGGGGILIFGRPVIGMCYKFIAARHIFRNATVL